MSNHMPTAPYAALDLGLHRTGVALSESGLAVQALPLITSTPPHQHELVQGVRDLVQTYQVATLIVGMPQTMDDQATSQSNKVAALVEMITADLAAHNLHPELVTTNEFGSTKAGKQLHPHLDDNTAAAVHILEEYLNIR